MVVSYFPKNISFKTFGAIKKKNIIKFCIKKKLGQPIESSQLILDIGH